VRRLVAAAVLAAMPDAAPAADAPPGPPSLCATCHGPLGVSNTPDAPHLAGQPRIYLAQQLRAFRSGKRVHEVMNVVAKPLKDEEIDAIAEWYAAVAIEAKPKR
jgi:cytochrome c553